MVSGGVQGDPRPLLARGHGSAALAVPGTPDVPAWHGRPLPGPGRRERCRVPASVSAPRGVTAPRWACHWGVCTMMGCPVPLPAPPNPAWGCRGAAEGVGVSRSHFPSCGRDRDCGHLPHPSRGPNPRGNTSWGFGAPVAPQGRTPRCCFSCHKSAGRGFAGTGWMIPGSVPHPSVLCSR